MRKYWPLTMMAAYLFCHALIYFIGLLWHLPPEIPREFRQIPRGLRNDPGILGGVLFGGTFLGMRWTQLARRRIAGVVVVAVSLLGQGCLIYFNLQTATSAASAAEFQLSDDARISRIPEAAMRSNRGHPGRSGRVAARFYFREKGVAIPYRDESDEVRMFEPDAKAVSARKNEVEYRRTLDISRPVFRAHDISHRWFGYSRLFLAAAAVFVSMGLFWQRESKMANASPSELPAPGQ